MMGKEELFLIKCKFQLNIFTIIPAWAKNSFEKNCSKMFLNKKAYKILYIMGSNIN